jgi:hypothetical protein
MIHTGNQISCAVFQSQLPELIGSGKNAADHPHLDSCPLCKALLGDLQTIAAAARQLFPIEEPPDALWDHIQLAIEKDGAISGTD